MLELVNPFLMTLLLLCEVEFSETVFIDWMCSESVFLAFSIQFLKLLRINFNQVPEKLTSINKMLLDDSKTNKLTDSEYGNVVASFKINELHGNELVQKTYSINECLQVYLFVY
jgi:hypothetical protein